MSEPIDFIRRLNDSLWDDYVPFSPTNRIQFVTLLSRPGPNDVLQLDYFGCDSAIPTLNAPWGLWSDFKPIPEYGLIPAGVSIGTVEVPILLAAIQITGELQIYVHKPNSVGAMGNPLVRVKATYLPRPKIYPGEVPPGPVDRVLGSLGRLWRGEIL